MPARDGTGPYGTYVNCVDPRTGLRRPLRMAPTPFPRLGRRGGQGRGCGRKYRGWAIEGANT